MAERHKYWSVGECGWVPSPAVVDGADVVRPRASNTAVPVHRDTAARTPDEQPVEMPAGTRLV